MGVIGKVLRRVGVRVLDWLVDVVIGWECPRGCWCDVCQLEHDGITS
jgi:hypothetical protein